jgi:competence protein ComEC
VRLSLVGAAPSTGVLVVCLVGAVAASSTGSRKGGFTAVVCLLLTLASAVVNSMPDKSVEAAVHFLDVGQGDATLVISRSRALLVDGGGSTADPAFGTRRLLPLLAERRARRIDTVLLSHPHPDHCGGLVTVLRDLEVGRLILSRRHVASECGGALMDIAVRRHIPVEDAESTRFLKVGEVSVAIVTVSHLYRRSRENNSSVLARLEVSGRRVLLPGDIEREAEMVLVEQEARRLSADILKVPHHGSRTSTTVRFLEAVRPRIAVVSSGRRNRFGHPHAEPLAELARTGVRVEGTATSGTLQVLFSQGHLFTRREFDSTRPYP